ncbi:MAG: hypothetical protein QXF00_00880 [Desulfurococcaceae archaeon]
MSQVQTQELKIEVPREKVPELYRFTDVYIYPSKFVTHTEYQKILWMCGYDIVSFLFYGMCWELNVIRWFYSEEDGKDDYLFDPVKAYDEIIDVLYENEKFCSSMFNPSTERG